MHERITTGCKSIDLMLNGGIEPGIVTQIFGEAGSGKTNICIQFAREVLKIEGDAHVVYIDTEGVSPERLAQVFNDSLHNLKRLLFLKPNDMSAQHNAICTDLKRLFENSVKVRAIICDTLTMYYRTLLNTEAEGEAKRMLSEEIVTLVRYARDNNIAVVVTNQVYTNVERNTLEPLGGNILAHNSKIIIELIRLSGPLRIARLIKHRSIKDGREARFRITDYGVSSEDGNGE